MPSIEVRNLTKNYGSFTALRGISFNIEKGEVVGFLGPNGAGKTTTMRILTGFLAPTRGEVRIENYDVINDGIEVRKRVGYLPENSPIYSDMLVKDYLKFIAEVRGIKKEKIRESIEKMVTVCGLKEVIDRPTWEISKGYRQRVGLAQAMIHDPDILICDEPTSGLDPNQIVEIRELIKKIGKEKTVILSTHILSEVQASCNRVIIINNGSIIADGTTSQLRGVQRGERKVTIKVRVPEGGPSTEKIQSYIKEIEGVFSVKEVVGEGRLIPAFEVSSSMNIDVRPKLFELAVKKGLTLLEMSQSEWSLEDIFRRLTLDDN